MNTRKSHRVPGIFPAKKWESKIPRKGFHDSGFKGRECTIESWLGVAVKMLQLVLFTLRLLVLSSPSTVMLQVALNHTSMQWVKHLSNAPSCAFHHSDDLLGRT